MADTENNVLMKYKNSAGSIVTLYPMTKKDNVSGLDEVIRDQSVVTTGDGSTYLAAVEGIDTLSVGVSFVMVPHVDSTSAAPKLNVNSLGDKFIRRRVSSSSGTTSAGQADDWLSANKPIRVTYDGMFWIADLPKPNATDLMGTVGIENGGTGATTVNEARATLGIADDLSTINSSISTINSNVSSLQTTVNTNKSNISTISSNVSSLQTTVNNRRKTFTATISTSWSGSGPYTQAVTVSGILATDLPHITPNYSTTNATAIAQKTAWNCVSKAISAANSITFTCFEQKPTTSIPIQIEVMR